MKNVLRVFCALLISATTAYSQNSKNMVLRSHMRFPGKELSNICGYVDSLGNEYALVGTSEGITIVDVTKPDSVFFVADVVGPNSIWREIKTWQHYAYVTTEGGGGLQIINLRNLPGTNLPVNSWVTTLNGTVLDNIHALHIDNGFVYLYGSNIANQGIVIADLSDPWNPVYAGNYNYGYVHDGYVRHDTVWAAQIFLGTFAAVDVTNKATPVPVFMQPTPNQFTHNTWLSDNSKYLFTTDEVNNSYLSVYDVSNIATTATFLDKIQSQNPGSQSIVHNTHILNDYAVTSWYKDGIVVTDGHRPQNLVNVGYADDCPQSGGGYGGVWGVYPFLPSGTIVTSDMDSGLYVYTPTYVRACYLEGIVHDSMCNNLLNNVHVQLIGTTVLDSTDFTGIYRTGTPDSGNYLAVFSKPGYVSKTVPVTLSNGNVTNVDVILYNPNIVPYSGIISDNASNPIPDAKVQINGLSNYLFITDSTGGFENCTTNAGQYNIIVGKWGYNTNCKDTVISASSNTYALNLEKGIYDDFTFDFGWTTINHAQAGLWQRAIPNGTFSGTIPANPSTDNIQDCSNRAFVTGNVGALVDNVNNGYTILNSPLFDITSYIHPFLNYSRWFCDIGANPNDTMHIYLSNGTTQVELETITAATLPTSAWVNKSIDLTGLIPFTATMKLSIRIGDVSPAHIVEGGFDHFQLSEGPLSSLLNAAQSINLNAKIYPNPSSTYYTFSYPDFSSRNDFIQLLIKDISGRIIDRVSILTKETTFGMNLKPGIYTVECQSKEMHYAEKLVKF